MPLVCEAPVKTKTLIVVHAAEVFEQAAPRGYIARLRAYIEEQRELGVRIIFLRDNELAPLHPELYNLGTEWDFGWGYEPVTFEDSPEAKWCISSRGHEYTWVPMELRATWIKRDLGEVEVVGGCWGECLTDFECVLDHLGIPYELNRAHIF